MSLGNKDMLLISDNSIDKIIKTGEASFYLPGRDGSNNGFGAIDIAHGLSKAPFWNIQCSVDGVRWWPAGAIDNVTAGPFAWIEYAAYTNNVHVTVVARTAGGARTVYVRYELFLREI